jgi:hypothetical protein
VGPRAGWAQRVEEKSSASAGDRTPVAPITILTELPRVTSVRGTVAYLHTLFHYNLHYSEMSALLFRLRVSATS